jgi:large subunit ribosomal protein L10
MPKTKEQKKEILNNLKVKIKKSKSVIFAKFLNLTVSENEYLRKKLKAENSEYYVAKKTLMGVAFKDMDIAELDPVNFDGRVAAIFGYGDELMPAKVLSDFIKEKDKDVKVEFIGGILENKYMGKQEVVALANIPSRNELYAKLVGSFNAPVSGFVNVLAGNLRNLVYVLKAVENKKA